jgi:cysteine-rich repeat protein
MTNHRGPRGALSLSLVLRTTPLAARVCSVAVLLGAAGGTACGIFDGNAGESSSEIVNPPTPPGPRPIPTVEPDPLPPLPPVEPSPTTVVDAGTPDAGADATLGTAPPASDAGPDSALPACGDGVLNAATEECDDGAPTSGAALCSASCRALEEPLPAIAGTGLVRRAVGSGRHPLSSRAGGFAVAYAQTTPAPLVLAQVFDAHDAARAPIALVPSTVARADANPVLASLPSGYVAAFTATAAAIDGETNIVLQRLGDGGVAGPQVIANAGTMGAHADADAVWTGSELVVAWTETSGSLSSPDVRFRRFDANLVPRTATDEDLGASADREGDVALAAIPGGWAAAWRTVTTAGEILRVRTPAATWSIGPYAAGPDGARPAIAPIDATHALVVYLDGRDPTDAGVSTLSALRAVVLDTGAPSTAAPPVPFDLTTGAGAISCLEVNAQRAGKGLAIAWRSPATPGDARGEELWIATVPDVGVAGALATPLAAVPVPRMDAHRNGDQRALGLALLDAPAAQLVAAWEDRGATFGPLEAKPDVVVLRLPPLR